MTRPKPVRDLPWLRQISSFGPSRIVLTANNFRIFDHLEGRGKTARALSMLLQSDLRATEILLDSLVAIGLLRKEGVLYRNDPVASRYLISGKEGYQGDILRHYSSLWDNWSGLDRVLKTGKPFRRAHDHASFILGMHNLASLKTGKALAAIPLMGVRKVLDLGGGPGTYSMAFARRGLDVTLMDFPETLAISRKLIKESGLQKKIRLLAGDFTTDDLGKGYDLIFISQIFHAYAVKDCLAMLRKCRSALTPGGRVVVQEFMLDETRTAPVIGALFSINMLVNTAAGRSYTTGEISSWLKKTGFINISTSPLDETVLISGRKKGRSE